MMKKINIDLFIFLPVLLLSLMGFLVLYSSSGGNINIVESQAKKIGLGLILMIMLSQMNSDFIKAVLSKPFYLLSITLLLGVFLFGTYAMGATRWLNLGFVRIQPSELLKLSLPMMLGYMIYKRGSPKTLIDIVKYSFIIIIPVGFIIVQPDLGTSILVALSGIYLLFQSGLRYSIMLSISAFVLAIFPLLWTFIKDYQKERILTMFNPESDHLGAGYHVIQSKIAIGNGGFSGRGYLEGTQTQLSFIPEQHTDFIFSALAEEFGFIGFFIAMFLYFIIIYRIFDIIRSSNDIYVKVVSGAIVMIFASYIFVNLGMVSGILPVVGVPLPFFSFGGTFVVTQLISFGIICSFSNAMPKRVLSYQKK